MSKRTLKYKTIAKSEEAPVVGSVVEEKDTIFVKQVSATEFEVYVSDETGYVVKLDRTLDKASFDKMVLNCIKENLSNISEEAKEKIKETVKEIPSSELFTLPENLGKVDGASDTNGNVYTKTQVDEKLKGLSGSGGATVKYEVVELSSMFEAISGRIVVQDNSIVHYAFDIGIKGVMLGEGEGADLTNKKGQSIHLGSLGIITIGDGLYENMGGFEFIESPYGFIDMRDRENVTFTPYVNEFETHGTNVLRIHGSFIAKTYNVNS